VITFVVVTFSVVPVVVPLCCLRLFVVVRLRLLLTLLLLRLITLLFHVVPVGCLITDRLPLRCCSLFTRSRCSFVYTFVRYCVSRLRCCPLRSFVTVYTPPLLRCCAVYVALRWICYVVHRLPFLVARSVVRIRSVALFPRWLRWSLPVHLLLPVTAFCRLPIAFTLITVLTVTVTVALLRNVTVRFTFRWNPCVCRYVPHDLLRFYVAVDLFVPLPLCCRCFLPLLCGAFALRSR